MEGVMVGHQKTASAIFTKSASAFVRAHLHALDRGECSLLIPSQDYRLLDEVAQRYDRVTVYSDQPDDPALHAYEITSVDDLPIHPMFPRELPVDQTVAVLFSSGST